MRWAVYQGATRLRETVAVSAAAAVNNVRWSLFGRVDPRGLGLRAVPLEVCVDVGALPRSRSALAFYSGAHAKRRSSANGGASW